MILDKIPEEESNYGEDKQREHISPNENDKKHLLGNGHHITRI